MQDVHQEVDPVEGVRGGRVRFLLKLLLPLLVIILIIWSVIWAVSLRHQRVIRFDPIADWNSSINEVPIEAQAWPDVRDGLLELMLAVPGQGEDPLSEMSGLLLMAGLDDLSELATLNGTTDVPIDVAHQEALESGILSAGLDPEGIRDWFQEQAPVFERLRSALGRPGFGAPYEVGLPSAPGDRLFFLMPQVRADLEAGRIQEGPVQFPLLELDLQYLAPLRGLGRLLLADACLAASEGDGMRAVDDLIAADALGAHLGSRPILIEQLVGGAIDSLVSQTGTTLLTHHPTAFDEADLARLAAAFSIGEEAHGRFRIALDGERTYVRDLMQRIYSDDGAGDGILLLEHVGGVAPVGGGGGVLGTLLQPFVNLYVRSRKEATTLFERHFDVADVMQAEPLHAIDWYEADQIMACFQPADASFTSKLRAFPMSLLGMDASSLATYGQLARTDREALQVIIALTRHRLRTPGAPWPESLEELGPDLLGAIPLDPYDGAALRYRIVDGQPRLWSIGNDCLDQRGVVPADCCDRDRDARRYRRPVPKVPLEEQRDWILWRGPFSPAR